MLKYSSIYNILDNKFRTGNYCKDFNHLGLSLIMILIVVLDTAVFTNYINTLYEDYHFYWISFI